MGFPTHFISCDWGTSNFRLRVVAVDSLAVLAQHATDEGIKEVNQAFEQSQRTDRQAFFAEYLRAQLASLPAEHRTHPIVTSGMASANIGMQDLPYGELPISEDGDTLVYEDISPWPGQLLRLISGVKSANGMMRGEETQALGLLEVMRSGPDGTLLLPGTHSKHLTFANGRFTDFTSYLTGELFELLSRQSILAKSVTSGKWNERTGAVFQEGVRLGYRDGYSPHLFSIRAGQILRSTNPTENFYRLSGLLIGDELSYLKGPQAIYLAGSGPLLRLYRFALETITKSETRLTVFADDALERALLFGQRQLLLRTKE